jgi:DNA-binding transcriptional regulator WhiA
MKEKENVVKELKKMYSTDEEKSFTKSKKKKYVYLERYESNMDVIHEEIELLASKFNAMLTVLAIVAFGYAIKLLFF